MAPLWPPGSAGGAARCSCQRDCKRTCQRNSKRGAPCSGGYTYLGLMFIVATLGLALAAAGALWSTAQRRDREAELLFVGQQFRAAITRFHDHTPVGQPARFPTGLDELLDDKRWPTTRRHLRKVFVDPLLGRSDWGLVRAPDGGVMGLHSLAVGTPYKRAGFPAGLEAFSAAANYRDWVFVYGAATGVAAAPSGPPTTPPPPDPLKPRP